MFLVLQYKLSVKYNHGMPGKLGLFFSLEETWREVF